MLSPPLSPKIRWQWIPFGWAAEGDLKVKANQEVLVRTTDTCINRLLPSETFYKKELTDIKGQEPGTITSFAPIPEFPIKKPELLFLAGETRTSPDDAAEEDWEPFSVGIYTEFKEFLGPHHIIHTLNEERHGAYPEDLKLRELSISPKVRVKFCRFGYEVFESRFASIFGYTPVVVKTLLIECSSENLSIRAVLEGITSKEKLLVRFKEFTGTCSSLISPNAA